MLDIFLKKFKSLLRHNAQTRADCNDILLHVPACWKSHVDILIHLLYSFKFHQNHALLKFQPISNQLKPFIYCNKIQFLMMQINFEIHRNEAFL